MSAPHEIEYSVKKALIVPINTEKKIFIQDRREYKKPDWGYFGGGVEEGETPIEAVIRETKEELSIDITETDLIDLGASTTIWNGEGIIRYMYLYPTKQVNFDVKEGNGGFWMTFDEVRDLFEDTDRFDDIARKIQAVSLPF